MQEVIIIMGCCGVPSSTGAGLLVASGDVLSWLKVSSAGCWCGRNGLGAHVLLNVASQVKEGKLDILVLLCRSLEELNSVLVSKFLTGWEVG